MKKKKSGDITVKRRAVRLSTMHRLAFKEWLTSKGYSGRYTVAPGLPEGSDINSAVDAACVVIMNDEQFQGKVIEDVDGAVIFHLAGFKSQDGNTPRGTITVLFKRGVPILYSRHVSMYLGVSAWMTSFATGTADADRGFVVQVTAKYPFGFAGFRQANSADYDELDKGA